MLIHVSNENPADADVDKDAIIRGLREQLQAAQKLSMLGTMSSMVVHEFNNLLTPVVNYAHLAKRNPKMVAKALEAATRAGDQAHAICSAFLGLSHEASDEPSPVRLGDLAQDCIAAMGRNPRRDNIVIHCDMHTGPVLLRRHDKLQQVLLNLLLNALLNKDGERWIRISSRLKDDQITLRVADNGPGMTRDVCEKIFPDFNIGTPNQWSRS